MWMAISREQYSGRKLVHTSEGRRLVKEIISEAESNMKKTIEVVKKEFASMRAGRATPALLDKITVNYYGVPTPVNQLANITVPEARLLVIQPWDKSSMPEIERAIMKLSLIHISEPTRR